MDISNSALWGTSVTSFQQAREWRHVNCALWEFQRGFCRRVTGGSERANGWWQPSRSLHTTTGLVQCTQPSPQNPSALRARRESIWLTEFSGRAPLPCHQGPGWGVGVGCSKERRGDWRWEVGEGGTVSAAPYRIKIDP